MPKEKQERRPTAAWTHGDKRRLLMLANRFLDHPLSDQGLCNILARRCRATPDQAIALECASRKLGREVGRVLYVDRTDWIWNDLTTNPLFSPLEVAEEVS